MAMEAGVLSPAGMVSALLVGKGVDCLWNERVNYWRWREVSKKGGAMYQHYI